MFRSWSALETLWCPMLFICGRWFSRRDWPSLISFPRNGLPVWKVCLALVVLAGVTVGVVACRKKRPYLLMGWLWYLGMLVPAIGLVQISYYARADRYTYLPEIGLAIAGTWAVADWSAGWKYRRAGFGRFDDGGDWRIDWL